MNEAWLCPSFNNTSSSSHVLLFFILSPLTILVPLSLNFAFFTTQSARTTMNTALASAGTIHILSAVFLRCHEEVKGSD